MYVYNNSFCLVFWNSFIILKKCTVLYYFIFAFRRLKKKKKIYIYIYIYIYIIKQNNDGTYVIITLRT